MHKLVFQLWFTVFTLDTLIPFHTYKFKNNVTKDTQEMPQSLSTASPRVQKKDSRGTNNDKINATYEPTDNQTNKIWKGGHALERSVKYWCVLGGGGGGMHGGGGEWSAWGWEQWGWEA